MKFNFAHIRERSTSGGWIDLAVFDAHSTSGSYAANNDVLVYLTTKARMAGYRIDQSALAFKEHSRLRFQGDRYLVDYLSRSGLPQWTNWIDA